MTSKARSKTTTKRGTKRATAKCDDKPIPQAAAGAGLPSIITPGADPALQLAFLKDLVVKATDLVGESLAGLLDQQSRESDYIDTDSIRDNLGEVLTALWQVRWECYATGGDVKAAKGGAS